MTAEGSSGGGETYETSPIPCEQESLWICDANHLKFSINKNKFDQNYPSMKTNFIKIVKPWICEAVNLWNCEFTQLNDGNIPSDLHN